MFRLGKWDMRNSRDKWEAAARSPLGFQSEEYKAACRVSKPAVKRLIDQWWNEKARSIQETVDAKDHNYQFAAYRELRQIFVGGHRKAG